MHYSILKPTISSLRQRHHNPRWPQVSCNPYHRAGRVRCEAVEGGGAKVEQFSVARRPSNSTDVCASPFGARSRPCLFWHFICLRPRVIQDSCLCIPTLYLCKCSWRSSISRNDAAAGPILDFSSAQCFFYKRLRRLPYAKFWEPVRNKMPITGKQLLLFKYLINVGKCVYYIW